MIWIKRWVKDFFFLSHSQVNGFVVLVPLLVLILFSAPVWQWFVSQQPTDFSKDRARLDSLITLWEELPSEKIDRDEKVEVIKRNVTKFDPNKASIDELALLGFSSSLSRRIVNYREKGGRFRTKSDLLKIYGMDSSFYQQLAAFINIPAAKQESRKIDFPTKILIPSKGSLAFDLNRADTTQLKKVFGIGEKLSLRIIKYRDALGGFVRMDQVVEVYGLDSAVVHRLERASYVETGFQPRKLNINRAEEHVLAAHPYLRKANARSIVAYRFQHGEFKTLDELAKIHTLDSKTIEKIAPYLTTED
jgi:DNA uptake protein ComE-like DNA-binding protein